MDALTDAITAITDALGTAGTAAVLAGLLMLVLLLVALVVRRRRGTTPEHETDEPATTLEKPTAGTVRRPIYADALLLDDLLAHAETRDYGRSLRESLDESSAATSETRKLNKVLAGLEERRMLVDLDDRTDAPLAKGSAVRVTGTLEELPASAIAELLELSTPVLVHSVSASGNGDGGSPSGARSVPDEHWGAGPKVLALTPSEGSRRFLVVLHPDGMRDAARRPLTNGEVTLLGVAEEVLGRRDKLDLNDYLTPYLSRDVQERVRNSDLNDTAESVANLAGHKVRRRDLTFEGPGARLSVAAIYR